jgi:outer membrane protein TolC
MWVLGFLVIAAQVPEIGLDLHEAVRLALEHHEDARIADWQVEQEAARRRQVMARLLPHASLGGSLVYRPSSSFSAAGVGTVDTDSRTLWTGRASVSATLVDLGALPDLIRAGRTLDAQELAAAEAKRLLGFAVAEQFLLVLAAEQLHAAANERVEVAEATVADAEARHRAGAGRPSDVTRAELERSSARLTEIETARDIDLARITLGDLLGDAGLGARPLVAPHASLLALAPDAAELGARARAQRNDLRQARLAVETAELAVWENLSGYLPQIVVSADMTKQDDGFVDRELGWTVAVGLSWSLFEGGRRLAQDSYLEASTEIAVLEEARLGRAVDTEVRSALRRLAASLAQLDEANLQAQLARKNRDETGSMFQHGLVTALERVDAIARAAEADATLVRRELEGRLAELTVLRAAGLWPIEVAGQSP